MNTTAPDHAAALLRHFADLRDRTHGDAVSRQAKERLFHQAVTLLAPYAPRSRRVRAAEVLRERHRQRACRTGS
ncbi:hypothetical protein [Streptosporangium roseum]|uniref:hypothetical protein n=1 Tax=Streptosporangium roseum TaxID=2001 RepID=UPI0033270D69